MAGLKRPPFFNVLMVNETGNRYEQIDRLMDKTDLNIFYLKGGIIAYGNYLKGLALSWQPRENRIKTVSKCKPCGPETKKESTLDSKMTNVSEE